VTWVDAGDLPSMLMPLDGIRVGNRARKDMGDIDALAASISEVGLLHPVVVDSDMYLLAGERRLAACRRLGFDRVQVRVAVNVHDLATALAVERDENTCRKDFTPEEAVRVAMCIEAIEKPKAEERKAEGRKRGAAVTNGQPALGAKLAPSAPPPPKVRDVAADAARMGRSTLAKAKAVVQAAEDPTLPEHVRQEADQARNEMNLTGKVDGPFKRVERLKAKAEAQDIVDFIEASPNRAHLKLRATIAKEWERSHRFYAEFTPEMVADSLDDAAEFDRWADRLWGLTQWFIQLEALRPAAGLRLIGES